MASTGAGLRRIDLAWIGIVSDSVNIHPLRGSPLKPMNLDTIDAWCAMSGVIDYGLGPAVVVRMEKRLCPIRSR